LPSLVKIYPQLLINVRVKDKELALNDPDVKAEFMAAEKRLGMTDVSLSGKAELSP
jgi:hypothetical protein